MDNRSGLSLLQLDPPRPYQGLLLGLDFGLKRIGVATGHTVTKIANSLTILHAKNGLPQAGELEKIIQVWQPQAIVLGIPLNMDDTPQPLTYKARQFALMLKKYGLPVHGMDERLTSIEARQRVFDEGGYRAIQKNQIDALAAKLILEEWMTLFQ